MAKLLMITGDRAFAEGKHGAFYNTLEEFHKYWERIDIICPKVNRGGASQSEVEPRFENVYVHSSPVSLLFQPFWILGQGISIYKKHKFDVMTVHEYPPFYNGIGARLLWQWIRVPYVLEIFHIPGYPKFSNKKELVYRSLVRVFISYDAARAKAVRIMNTDVGKFLELSGVMKNKLSLIPAVYVDTDIFKPVAVPKEYDLIFIGRLESNKGVDLLLEAASKLKFKILNFKLLLVGDGPLMNDLKLKIKNLKLQDNVLLYGYAKDSAEIAHLLNKSRVLVMPSYNEGGPRVVVEAMACGVPVLATQVGIVPDLLKNLPAGRQVALGGEIVLWDSEDIAMKALGLLNDPEVYKKHSLAAVEMAKPFEKKAAIKNYADKIQALIK